LLICRDS